MDNIEQLKKFRDKLKEYQKTFKERKEYTVALAFDKSIINREQQLREELNEMWGELENVIVKLWGERPKQVQYNSVFPVFETALSGNLESPLTGGAILSAIQVVIKCIGKAKANPEALYKKGPPATNEGQDTIKSKIARSKPKGIRFSMSNPFIWLMFTLIAAAIAYFLFK